MPRSLTCLLAAALGCGLLLTACGDKLGEDVAACGSSAEDGAYEVVYRMISPGNGAVPGDELERTAEIICERAQALGNEAVVERKDEHELRVSLSGEGAAQAAQAITVPTQVAFYDWAANLIPDPDAPVEKRLEAPFPDLYPAVRLASGLPPDCVDERCTLPGAVSYLFDLESKQLVAGPSLAVENLIENRLEGEEPGGYELRAVRVGQIVVQEQGTGDAFVLRDRPGVRPEQIDDARVVTDPGSGRPAVAVEFTEAGQVAFERMTRRIVLRAKADPSLATPAARQYAVALDLELLERPVVDGEAHPKGLDASDGAVLTGDFSTEEAEQLAEFLRIGVLPVGLVPVP